jgi:hypothetical protein
MKEKLLAREAELIKVMDRLDEQYDYAWARGMEDLAHAYTVGITYTNAALSEVQRMIEQANEDS